MRVLSFDPATNTLLVELPNFPHYKVFDVPMQIFDQLQSSTRPERFFNKRIWGNNFEHDSHWASLDALLEYMSDNMFFDRPCTVSSNLYDGDTPLHIACVWGDVSAVELCIAGGADVNAKGDLSTTPIYNAVSFNRIRCVELLLKAGATIDDANALSTARERALSGANQAMIGLFSTVPRE